MPWTGKAGFRGAQVVKNKEMHFVFQSEEMGHILQLKVPGSPFTDSMKAAGPGLLLSLCDFCWVDMSQFGKWQFGASH